jgi:hypothetical protein
VDERACGGCVASGQILDGRHEGAGAVFDDCPQALGYYEKFDNHVDGIVAAVFNRQVFLF